MAWPRLETEMPHVPILEGRVAVITGAADGIGRGIAQRLAEDGVKLVLTDIDAPTGEATTGSQLAIY